MFSGLTASDYVFRYHVLVSRRLLVMALAHYEVQTSALAHLTDGDVLRLRLSEGNIMILLMDETGVELASILSFVIAIIAFTGATLAVRRWLDDCWSRCSYWSPLV